jgi:hypothetical protein
MKMLVDGSKLYFAAKRILGSSRLDYNRLSRLANREKMYYTSFNPTNDKQESFIRLLQGRGFEVITKPVYGDDVYDFDAQIAYMLGKWSEPCYVLSNSKYLLPLIKETQSTLCWFSGDLPADLLLSAYRDHDINFMDMMETEG